MERWSVHKTQRQHCRDRVTWAVTKSFSTRGTFVSEKVESIQSVRMVEILDQRLSCYISCNVYQLKKQHEDLTAKGELSAKQNLALASSGSSCQVRAEQVRYNATHCTAMHAHSTHSSSISTRLTAHHQSRGTLQLTFTILSSFVEWINTFKLTQRFSIASRVYH